MIEEKDADPVNNFTGLAKVYESARPGYPASGLRQLLSHCALERGATLVDVGSGTGISARAFAQLGLKVIGIEPNGDMRSLAESANKGLDFPAPAYQLGRAESTGLASASTDAVAAGQAFHWFRGQEALLEFSRILKTRGWVILLWNERQEADPFTKSYGDVIRALPRAAEIEMDRSQAGQLLLTSDLFHNGQEMVFENEQELDEERLIGRAFSSSYAPREAIAADNLKQTLKSLFEKYKHREKVLLRYVTNAYLAQKAN
jgi:ubiquinone/menaquinone biosynthesis C-methylase UbiE